MNEPARLREFRLLFAYISGIVTSPYLSIYLNPYHLCMTELVNLQLQAVISASFFMIGESSFLVLHSNRSRHQYINPF